MNKKKTAEEKTDDFKTRALLYIQKMSEAELTLYILLPLFKVIGYEKVDYHGGPYEGGKDIVLCRNDELDMTEFAAVQVKKWKLTAKADDTKSFQGVLNQLQVASEEPIPHTDGQKYIPSTVYFVTPFELDTRSLQTRFVKYQELRSRRVKIIDGSKLVSLIQKKLPELYAKILGTQIAMQSVVLGKLNNSTLLCALDYRAEKNISTYYSDLDITFGNITSNAFLNIPIMVTYQERQIGISEWKTFRKICIKARNLYDLDIIDVPYQIIDDQFEKIKSIPDEEKVSEKLRFQEGQRQVDEEQSNSFSSSSIEKGNRNSLKNGNLTKNVSNKFDTKKSKINEEVLIKFKVSLISDFFQEKKYWLINQMNLLNSSGAVIENYREILIQCHQLFEFLDLIINSETLSDIYIFDRSEFRSALNEPTIRISTPITDLFDTGLNLAILGDAGAGKTTCLQIQALNALRRTNDNKVVLFLPLAQVLATHNQHKQGPNIVTKDDLNNAIISFFRSEGTNISLPEFQQLLEENKSLLLFDGIDEVITTSPFILNAIYDLGEDYSRAQVVISTRTGGEYVEKIKYLGLSLLPFSSEQRDSFISGWFEKAKEGENYSNSIFEHLESNKDLQEIIRKPLLATIMCVLAENNIPLPKNEIRLYKERINLLTGHYDIHKKATRTKSTQNLLENVARKLAFRLHEQQARYESIDKLIDMAVEMLVPMDSSRELVITAVQELVYPCNILVKMNHEGRLGFGLLRYQEYLAATELQSNRGISYTKHLSLTWWRGAMIIFSRLNNHVEFIFDDAIKEGNIMAVKDTLYAILEANTQIDEVKYKTQIEKAISKEERVFSISSLR
ncbi:MAG: NACHT domain-containing protein [Sedimenticola sp.]